MKWNEIVNANWARARINAVSASATRSLPRRASSAAAGKITRRLRGVVTIRIRDALPRAM